jgi:hypothetical protein
MTSDQEAFIARITVELEDLSARLAASVQGSPTLELAVQRSNDSVTCRSAARLLVILEEDRRQRTRLIDQHVTNMEKVLKP